MNRQTTTCRLKGAGLALMVWLWPVMALAASAVFDGTAANTWVMDNNTGKIVGSYTIPSGGPDGWTTEVSPKIGFVAVHYLLNSSLSSQSPE